MAVDRTLRQLRGIDRPFGGLTFVLMGDTQQVLPVVRRGNRAQVVAATIQSSSLWRSITALYSFDINMRVEVARRKLGAWRSHSPMATSASMRWRPTQCPSLNPPRRDNSNFFRLSAGLPTRPQ